MFCCSWYIMYIFNLYIPPLQGWQIEWNINPIFLILLPPLSPPSFNHSYISLSTSLLIPLFYSIPNFPFYSILPYYSIFISSSKSVLTYILYSCSYSILTYFIYYSIVPSLISHPIPFFLIISSLISISFLFFRTYSI